MRIQMQINVKVWLCFHLVHVRRACFTDAVMALEWVRPYVALLMHNF